MHSYRATLPGLLVRSHRRLVWGRFSGGPQLISAYRHGLAQTVCYKQAYSISQRKTNSTNKKYAYLILYQQLYEMINVHVFSVNLKLQLAASYLIYTQRQRENFNKCNISWPTAVTGIILSI